MKKLAIATSIAFAAVSSAFAQTNPSTNHSATQFKTGNRNASTGAEAVFYNPAGTVFGEDGVTVEFSVLPFTSSQSVEDSEMGKTYESTTSNLFYPAFNIMYKKDRFSVYANLGVTNGGGAGSYDDGLPQFERLGIVSMFELIGAGEPGLPSTNPMDYTYGSEFEGSSFGIGGYIGGAYRFADWISASAAVQYAHQTNHEEGYLSIGYAGNSISKMEVDADHTGTSLGFIFGLNLKPTEKLLIAQTFRYYTETKLETEVNKDDTQFLYQDGAETMYTYAPYYSLGVSYNVTDRLRVEGDVNVSFYSMLDDKVNENIATGIDNYNNGVDFGIGAEYQISDCFNWGAGFTYAPAKMKKEAMSEMEFDMNMLWLNTGATVKLNDKLTANAAIQVGLATEDVEKTFDSQLIPGTTYTQTYKKDPALSLGLGISYRF